MCLHAAQNPHTTNEQSLKPTCLINEGIDANEFTKGNPFSTGFAILNY